MDTVQHHTTPSGHESHHHGVHLCHRCGWPYPKPHPSAKHRRAHKKICGTIEGYTTLIGSEVVSDDDGDDLGDKEKTPSPKIGKKTSIGGSFSRSEDELFSDAVTEFAETGNIDGSVKKTLDRDLFYSFTDANNAVDTGIEVSETKGPHVEKIEEADEIGDSSESNLELNETGGLVKDAVVEPAPEPSHVSKSQEVKSVDVIEAREDKGQESQTSVAIPEEAKDSDVTKTAPEVSVIVGGNPDNVEQENFEKSESLTADGISEETKKVIKSDGEHVSEVGKESETVETDIEKSAPECEITPEVVKGSENDQLSDVSEEIKHDKLDSDHKHVLDVAKESEIDQKVSVLTENVDQGAPNEQIQEVFEEPLAVLTEKTDLEEPELGKGSREEIKEAVKEPVAVVIEKEDIEGTPLEKQSNDHAPEVVEKPDSILTAKDLGAPELEGGSEELIQENVKEPDTILTEKEDLGGPHLEKQSNTDEVVGKSDTVLTEKQDLEAHELDGSSKEQIQEVVMEPGTVLTEKEDLGGPHLEKQSNEHVDEVVKKPDSVLTEKKDLDAPELAGSLTEQFQEVVKEPDTVLTEKEDLEPCLETQSNEHTNEVVEKPDSILTEKQDVGAAELEKHTKENNFEEPVSVLTEKEDLGVLKSETCSKDEVIEQKANVNRNLIADVSTETVVEEGNGKLTNNQDSAADLTVDSSSHNSLEGNWGSVSVLSTASIDAETSQLAEKSKVNPGKTNTATSDVYEPLSFMTLVEPESKDKKPEVQDSQPPPKSEASQAGWFPTLTKVNNESEGRKRNEEAMAKVTNWNAEKQSTPLKNLLGEAKSPTGKQPDPVVKKDEEVVTPPVNDDVASPPKLIEDDKKGGKKVKGRSLWVPFACCSSVNAVK